MKKERNEARKIDRGVISATPPDNDVNTDLYIDFAGWQKKEAPCLPSLYSLTA